MNIATVIPISRAIGKESLSYFTKLDLKAGFLVNVPLRGKFVLGIVVDCQTITDSKSEIKNLPFPMRKIERIISEIAFSSAFLKSIQKTAEYYATTAGAVMAASIPTAVWNTRGKKSNQSGAVVPTPQKNVTRTEHDVLQAETKERMADYKSLIRENFARNKSLFFCLPSEQHIDRIFDILSKGIESRTIVLHSSISQKELARRIHHIETDSHPVLIIATCGFLSIPRSDLQTIILENENSAAYRTFKKPYIDFRTFVEFFSKETGTQLIIGDILLRTETLWRVKNNELQEFTPIKFRSISNPETVLIDMAKKNENAKAPFRMVSDALRDLIVENKTSSGLMFMLVSRKGLAPTTLCHDCGAIVRCRNCNWPMTLHGNNEKRFFLCHKCGEKSRSDTLCTTCGSWNLVPLGIGIEGVAEELKKVLPDVKYFVLSHDVTKTHTKASRLRDTWQNAPGSVLIGTEMAIPYLPDTIENTAIVSIDSLFSLPDFRISEKIMKLILEIKERTTKKFLVQTRQNNQPIFDFAIAGNLLDFYRREIAERKNFGYPPFSVMIKISVTGKKALVQQSMTFLKTEFDGEDLVTFSAFVQPEKENYAMHCLIKVERKMWVKESLARKLTRLPPYFHVYIDPQTLL